MMRKYLLLLGASVALMLGLCATNQRPVDATVRATATIYLHGHHGGERSMDDLMASAEAADDAHSVITAVVQRDGKVDLHGYWPADTVRPLVKLVFKNNRTTRRHRISNWLRNVLVALRDRYGITKFNMVAHSMGNIACLFYELRYGRDPQMPQLHKYVALGGNFDGIPGHNRHQHPNHTLPDGRPAWLSPNFKQALRLRQNFPRKVQVLNIYGDMDGQHNDGKVLNASSRSLGFLLKKRLKSYREIKVRGWEAQHAMLRSNPQVALNVNQFLFP